MGEFRAEGGGAVLGEAEGIGVFFVVEDKKWRFQI